MNSLATDIKQLIAKRVESASAADIYAIAYQLCAANEPTAAPAAAPGTRFTKLGTDGRPTAGDWVAVHDAKGEPDHG